ncbi:protein FAM151A-like [Glandiceps talaboti]
MKFPTLRDLCIFNLLTLLLLVSYSEGSCKCTNTIVNIADYFEAVDGDGLYITWAHGVNSQDELDDALHDNITMMLEGDIVLEGMGTPNETNTPVMAHPPMVYSDITLEEWVYKTTETRKGMKLDFKQLEAVSISMEIVKGMEERIHQPVWVNADIVQGPNSESDPIAPVEFISTCNAIFPLTVMSLGWTTNAQPWATDDMYTWSMIFDNLQYSYPLKNPVTFPIRALWTITTWPKYIWMLGLRDDFSITVWHGSADIVDIDGLVALRKHGDPARIYYDVPARIMNPFLEALEEYENVTVEINRLWKVNSWRGIQSGAMGDYAYLSLEGAGLAGSQHGAHIESVDQHKPSEIPTEIHGRVQFAQRKKDRYFHPESAGLEIYIRSSGVSNMKTVTGGVRIHIGQNGELYMEPNQDGGEQSRVTGSVGTTDCYNFTVTDKSMGDPVTLKVTPVKCSDGFGGEPSDTDSVEIHLDYPDDDDYFYVVMTKSGDDMDVVLEDVHVLSSTVSSVQQCQSSLVMVALCAILYIGLA